MAADAPLEIRLDAAAAARLRELAAETGRPEAELAAEAVEAYLQHDTWFRDEMSKGLAAIDAGDFATDEEMRDVLRRWL